MTGDSVSAWPAGGPPLLEGSGAGFLATVPMSVVMVALWRLWPRAAQGRLPFERIALSASENEGPIGRLADPWRLIASVSVHFSIGSAGGLMYTLVPRVPGVPPVVRGIVYGLLVWAAGYLGWMPALGLFRPATQQPARQNVPLLASHIVWGAAVGLLMARVEAQNQPMGRNNP